METMQSGVRCDQVLTLSLIMSLPLVLASKQNMASGDPMAPSDNRSSEATLPLMSAEKRLCRSLMANYTSVGLNGRPVVNMSQPIVVDFGLGLIQMDLDERNKILTTSMWARYKWNDEYLKWEPSQYSGVRSIKLISNVIWKPDIMLYNTAETDKAEREVLAVVGYDGTVLWVPHQIFRSSCSIDVANFPFDYQECSMYFGSWTYSIEDVDPRLAFDSGIDLSTFMSDYKESCSWEVVNNTAERKALPEDNPAYVVLSFTLKMRRKMVFSSYILTLPCVFLAALTLVVFWLPPDRPDRTSLAMSIFASFLVLLLILVEAAPPTASSVPTLGVYYCFNMVIIMMSIFLSTLVVNICRGGDHTQRVPKWLLFVTTHILSRILCVHGKIITMTQSRQSQGQSQGQLQAGQTLEERHSLLGGHVGKAEPTSPPPPPPSATGFISAGSREICENGSSYLLHAEVASMRLSLQEMASSLSSRFRAQERRRQAVVEWQCIALVLDRTFFYLYLAAIICSLFILFPRPQY